MSKKKKKDTLGHHKKGRKSQNMANNTKPLLCQTSVSLGRKFSTGLRKRQTGRRRRRWRTEPPAGFSEFYSVVIDQPHMTQQP